MQILHDEKRLQLLNANEAGALWRSCSEKRRCIACERTFRGTSVVIRRGNNGVIRLECPGCGGSPDQWVRLGNPLTDEEVWADWQRAIERSAHAANADAEREMAQ